MRLPTPTFEALREHGELRVINPATGARFTIQLCDWQGTLWGVKVVPESASSNDWKNPFVTKHRIMARSCIEEWLEGLRLAEIPMPRLEARKAHSNN